MAIVVSPLEENELAFIRQSGKIASLFHQPPRSRPSRKIAEPAQIAGAELLGDQQNEELGTRRNRTQPRSASDAATVETKLRRVSCNTVSSSCLNFS